MAHVRERPSLQESTEIITPSGKRYRWATDEPKAENVPRDERWSDVMPGGFEMSDQTLPRKPEIDYADLERLSRVTRYDASGGVIWQGRLERAPRTSGDQVAISPSAVGYQAHLEDDKSVQVIFRDIGFARWESPSVEYRLGAISASPAYAMFDPTTEPDVSTGEPSLKTSVQGPWINRAQSAATYDASGTSIGSVYYAWKRGASIVSPFTNFDWVIRGADNDTMGSGLETTADLAAAGPGTGTLVFTNAKRFAQVIIANTATGGADGLEYPIYWTTLAVYGDHGLTKRGTEPAAGFYDADMVGYAINQWCPLLSITSDSVTADTFVIPQADFRDPTTVGEIVRQVTRFRLRDWAVWEGPVFWLHDRGARGNKWKASVGPAQLEETGPQVDRLWESVIVQYQDVDGSTRTVGPVGSGADVEHADLKDDDTENPANKVGITRRDLLTMGISTPEGAVEVGRRFLEETKQLDSSGRARIVGHVQDDKGVWHPYSHVRAGDTISFVDAADTSYRRIVKTDKNRADRTCAVDLDAPPEGLQALLERLGVVLVPLGI